MNLYKNEEENIYLQKEIKSWYKSGLICEAQFDKFVEYARPGVKSINHFFEGLLFIFTIIFTAAVVGFTTWKLRLDDELSIGFVFLFFGFAAYFAGEFLVKKYSLYRHGIEEALAISGCYLFCTGAVMLLRKYEIILEPRLYVIISSALASAAAFFLYKRWGYLIMASLSVFALSIIPFQLELPPFHERLLLFVTYALILYINLRAEGPGAPGYLKFNNSVIQACLLFGLYIASNVRLQNLQMPLSEIRNIMLVKYAGMPPAAYWASFAFIFILPAITLFFGLRTKKRAFIDMGAIMAALTICTYKDYLGWTHYVWEPIIFGGILVTVALAAIKWFEKAKDKIRSGYTSESDLKPENYGIDVSVLGVLAKMPAADGSFEGPGGGGGTSGGAGVDRGF